MSISRIFLSAGTLLFALLFVVSVRSQCSNAPNSLTVHDLPVIDDAASGFKSLDTLTLVVKSKQVDSRSDAVITMKAGTAACNYPGANWVRSVDNTNCFEIWTATMSWSVASGCGLNRTDNGTFLIFEAFIDVKQVDNIVDIRGQSLVREMNTSLVYQLVFPKTIEMATSPLTIYAPVLVQAAVVSQEYAPATSVGTVGVFVSLQWPFQLANVPTITSSALLIGTPTISTADSCSGTVGAACNRVYYINVPRGTACSLNGTYTIESAIQCIPAITEVGFECPVQSEDAEIIFTLSTEDLCNRFNEVVDLSATLKSYLPNFSTERKAFIQGQTAYFEIALSSTEVSVEAVTIQAITTNWGGSNTTLNTEYTVVTEAIADKARFSFEVTNALFNLAADSRDMATVYARVAVTFQNTAGRKRTVVKDVAFNKRQNYYVQSAEASTQIEVSSMFGQGDGTLENGASTVAVGVFGALVALLLIVA